VADTRPPLSRNVKALGVVSLFADVASEMVYPLLPAFITITLGASGAVLGTIEGVADATSSLLKLASGWWADRVRSRKPLVVAGYLISAIARPLVALAAVPRHVLVVRFTDRTGKGIRTSPRDALLADSTDPTQRGRAYGYHRAMDNVGAVLGPLLAWALVELAQASDRTVFAWSALPGLVSVLVLIAFVRESPRERATPPGAAAATGGAPARGAGPAEPGAGNPGGHPPTTALPPVFWKYLAVLFVFTLSASSDAFLLIRARQLGVAVAVIPLMYALLNLVRAVASTPAGALSDRVGRRLLIAGGWGLYAVVYLGFGVATEAWHAWSLFAVYGLFYALTEGAERALVADLVPPARRGTAFGWFHFAVGAAALPASLGFGLVWDRLGAAVAFGMAAAIAGVATVGLLAFVPAPKVRA
jgi:MFS family permease